MNERIQSKIDHYRGLAKGVTEKAVIAKKATSVFRSTDSLSKAIRNKKEADIFLEELQAAIKIAGGK